MRSILTTLIVATAILGTGSAHAQQNEIAKLEAPDPLPWSGFGYSVSVCGDTAVIGSNRDNDNGSGSGSAYVFVYRGGAWTQQAKLLPDDGAKSDSFGHSVAISNDTIVVGAVHDAVFGMRSGSAYVFARSGDEWTQQAKLLPADGAEEFDQFGVAVSVSGDTVVVGMPLDDDNGRSSGSAYVYTRSDGAWSQQAKLLPDDGGEEEIFGNSVSICGDTVVVGSRGDADNGIRSGSAFVFTRSGDVWTQQAKLLPADGQPEEMFGSSVSVDHDTAVVGAQRDDDNGFYSGSAYVYTRSDGDWSRQAKLLPDDGAELDFFGVSVSISGDAVVVGSLGDDNTNGEDAGSAYLFTRSGDAWIQRAKFLPSDGTEEDWFGFSVSVDGDATVIGARFAGADAERFGAAYVFDLAMDACVPDLNGDGEVNADDFYVFQDAWTAGDTLADWDDNGVIDTRDFVAYLNDWVVGCP